MGNLTQRITAAVLVSCLCSASAMADTAAGIAAYNSGDYGTALKLLRPEAENGDAEAQVKYGLIFAKGLGVLKDGSAAFKWFQKSAAQGNAEAMYCVGVAYDVGDAGTQDLAKAVDWYRKSAELGYAKAQYNLGQMLQTGDGVVVNFAESVKWLQKAADQGNADAEYRLSYSYFKGLGVERNLLSIRYWAERAESHGNEDGKRLAEFLRGEFKELETKDHVPRTSGGDGSTIERAIYLPDAKTEFDGVDAEHAVLRTFFQEWQEGPQSLSSAPDNRPIDIITIEKDGVTRDVYFDISNWFGHMH